MEASQGMILTIILQIMETTKPIMAMQIPTIINLVQTIQMVHLQMVPVTPLKETKTQTTQQIPLALIIQAMTVTPVIQAVQATNLTVGMAMVLCFLVPHHNQ